MGKELSSQEVNNDPVNPIERLIRGRHRWSVKDTILYWGTNVATGTVLGFIAGVAIPIIILSVTGVPSNFPVDEYINTSIKAAPLVGAGLGVFVGVWGSLLYS